MINGIPAKPGMFPWMVVLSWVPSSGKGSQCSGFIVSNTAILAAAHCLYLSDDLTVLSANYSGRVGSIFRKRGKKIDLKVMKHPKFNRKYQSHDISILFPITGELPLSDYVHPIALEDKFQEPKEVMIMGWGRTTPKTCVSDPGVSSRRLLYQYQTVTKTRKRKIHVKGLNSSTCRGDSGSPLVEKREDQYVAFGILSTGYNVASFGREVFTRISYYKDFILEHAGNVKFV